MFYYLSYERNDQSYSKGIHSVTVLILWSLYGCIPVFSSLEIITEIFASSTYYFPLSEMYL